MVNEGLASLLCLVNLIAIGGMGLLLAWVRRRFAAVHHRLTTVEAQLAQLGQAAAVEQLAAPVRSSIPPASMTVDEPTPIVQPPRPIPAPPVTVSPAPLDGQGRWPELATPAATAPPATTAWRQHPLLAWFVQVHLMVQIGVVVLFFGVGFLVKYAVDQGWFPLELRLISAALLGVALATVGWRVRTQRRTYGLALIGGGIGIVYLTTFGAYYFYGLLPALLAFTIFVLLALTYALMAMVNDAPILAFLAIVGAFLAPWLTADDSGSYVVLFSYYAVVNLGILALAWAKRWSGLNLVSFLFTLAAGVTWGATAYHPTNFVGAEAFLLGFFGFYLLIAYRHALRTGQLTSNGQPVELRWAAVLLLFANPLATFTLQSLLVAEREHWLAYSAFGFALLYGLLAAVSQRLRAAALFSQGCSFFAGFFLLIGIPLRFDPQVTAALWAVQGLGQLWLGVRSRRTWPQAWGLLVQLLAGGAFLVQLTETPTQLLPPFLNSIYLSTLILAVAAILSATLVYRYQPTVKGAQAVWLYGLFGLGLGWWYGGGLGQWPFYGERTDRWVILLLFFVLSGLLGEGYGVLVGWRGPRVMLMAILPAAWGVALYLFAQPIHPFTAGWYIWPVILAVQLFYLWRGGERVPTLYHAGGLWLATFLLTWWSVRGAITTELAAAWLGLAWLLVPTVALWLGTWLAARTRGNAQVGYGFYGAAAIALFLFATALWINQRNPGTSAPLPFVPLLNPLDLLLATVIVVLWQWSRWVQGAVQPQLAPIIASLRQWAIWLLSLWVFNLALARGLHHLIPLPFTWSAFYGSALVQTVYALVWGVLALALMYLAHHRHWRAVWSIGAALLGLTIVKLFIVDLANTGTLARIVSFISIGLLTITIAYFWPAPPRTALLPNAVKQT